jgi:hypothetical protein
MPERRASPPVWRLGYSTRQGAFANVVAMSDCGLRDDGGVKLRLVELKFPACSRGEHAERLDWSEFKTQGATMSENNPTSARSDR